WCQAWEGLGVQRGASTALLVRDATKSLREGALAAWPALTAENPFTRFAEALARHGGFLLDTPYQRLEPAQQRLLLYGSGDAWIALDPEPASRRRTAGSPRFPDQ